MNATAPERHDPIKDMAGAAALRRALERLQPLSEPAWADLLALATARRVDAGTHLLVAGEQSLQVLFIVRGLLREYYVDAQGREFTRRFGGSGDFSGSLADLLAGGAAEVSIQAMQASQLVLLPWAQVDALADQHACLTKLLRRFAEQLYLRKMRREFELLALPAAQRLLQLQREEPGLDGPVPDHLLASYLGITPVHLSRLRSAARSAQSPAARRGRS